MKKKIPRIFMPITLIINTYIFLPCQESHYIQTVLRMKENDILEIFNNTNYIFLARIKYIKKKNIQVFIFYHTLKDIESNINIHLGQVISKDEKMNFTIQKAVELGITSVTPLILKNLYSLNDLIHIKKKIIRWKRIAIAACQQCNRNLIPIIKEPMYLQEWCIRLRKKETKVVFHPKSVSNINQLQKSIKEIYILIGAEKGFSKDEITKITDYGFVSISLGPRILRTETASVAAISILQFQFGDLN